MGSDRFARGHLVGGVPREAFRPSVVFLCVAALFAASGWMAWSGFGNARVNVFLFVVSGWVVSLCLHEYAHAVVAYRAGDLAVAERGYLTLNPLRYTHPLLSIILPVVFILLGGIGLPGGAVWVDRHAIRGGRVVDSLISLAGPATNVLFTLALMVPLAFVTDTADHHDFWVALAFLAFLQLTASLLNLATMPGLDGGNMVYPWLSPQWRRGFDHVAPYGMLLLFALLWNPTAARVFFGAVFAVGDVIGLPRELYAEGFDAIRFWQG
ncbi:MAG TPA: site-2 protease family protein [Micromonosporaceae bacterium]|nr:site-2 protease family protein [Micromonosporaceae bacterium]